MKTSKLLITSLLAAATMSATAFGATTVTVGDYTQTFDSITTGNTAPTSETPAWWITGNRAQISAPSNANKAGVIILGTGTYSTDGGASTSATATQLFLQGWEYSSAIDLTSTLVLGANSGDSNAALRFGADGNHEVKVSGDMILGADAKIIGGGTHGAISGGISGNHVLTITNMNSAFTLAMTGATDKTISLSGLTISENTTVGMNYKSASLGVLNLSGTSASLSISGAENSYSAASLAGTGALTLADGVTFTLNNSETSAGTNQTFSGTLSGSGKLELTGGVQKLSGAVSVGAITVTDGSLDLSGARVSLGSAIQNSGTVTVSDATVFNLTQTGTTALITGGTISGYDSLTISNFTYYGVGIDTMRSTWNASSSSVAVTLSVADLTWAGTPENSTWDVKTTQNWTNVSTDDVFHNGDNVTFSGDATVTVADGGVTAGTVKIAAGTVTLSGGKVTAVNGFVVGDGVSENDSIATLVLSSNNALCGDVTVNKGGTFDLHGQSDSMSESGRIGKVVLNGGSLTSTGGDQGTSKRQIYNLEVTADSKIIGDGTFGILGSGYAVTTLNLGANTLTKSGSGSFVLVKTTISGNGGVLDVTEGKILGKIPDNDGDHMLTLGEGVTLKTSGTGGAQDVKIASMGANSKLILGGSTASTVALNSFALGAGAVIDVSGANAVTGTITSMAEGSALKLAGTTANTVTLNGVVGANAVVSVSGNSAVTGTITDLGDGAQLTLAGTGASSVTWRHDGADKSTNASIFIGARSTFTDVANHKYHLTLSGTLSGAGTLVSGVATAGSNQSDSWRKITLSGSTAGFTGEWQLESANGDGNTDNRHVLGILNSSDGVFGGVVKFTSTNADSAKISSKLVLLKDMKIGGLEGTLLANTSVVGASAVSNNTDESITKANRALTINVAEGKSYDYAGKIDSTISLKKTGAGTQILSGDNSAYTGAVTLEAGTLVAGHANALGTNTVTVTGDATLQMDPMAVPTFVNNVSVADGKTLSVLVYTTDFTGTLSGNGNVSVKTLTSTELDVLTLSGDNTGLAGTLSVGGLASINAKHVNALGSGTLKIITMQQFGVVGTGTVNAAVAGVKLNNVSISLKDASTAVLTAGESCNFTVAGGATLYLDIGALGADVLTPGENVSLTIAAGNAIDSFFSTVEVGTYDAGSWVKDLQWAYVDGSWDVGAGTLSIAIPEPSVFGLLAGLGALALAGTRRRRRKA